MGWCSDELPAHEGYLVGLIPVEKSAARAATWARAAKRDPWLRYVDREGFPYRWRELHGGFRYDRPGNPPVGDPPQEHVRAFQVGCSCGWRSRLFYASQYTQPLKWWPNALEADDATEQAGRREWLRHIESEARAELEETEIARGKRCSIPGCGLEAHHDARPYGNATHDQAPMSRRLLPALCAGDRTGGR